MMSNQLQQTMQAVQALSPTEQIELIKFMLAELVAQPRQKLTLIETMFQFLRELRFSTQALRVVEPSKPALVNMIGTAKGSFASPAEVDNFIQGEREAWID